MEITTAFNISCQVEHERNSSVRQLFEELINSEAVQVDPVINLTFNGIGLLILTVVGVPVNILSFIVLSHPRLKSSLTTLLLGLTISDILVIVTSFLIFCLNLLFEESGTGSWYSNFGQPFLIPWLLPIALTAQMSSVYFTVVITLERYIAVCLPLQVRSLCTNKSTKWTSIAVVIFSIIYNIPRWLEFEVVQKVNCTTGQVTGYQYLESNFRTDFFVTYYANWAYLVFMYIIPFTLLFYFNTAIYKQTKMHRNLRSSLSPSMTRHHDMSEDIQLAGMLFGIVITFIACNILAVVINVIDHVGMDDWMENLIPISNFLIVLACSTNFIFFCVFGTEFRRRLKSTLRFESTRKSSSERSETWVESLHSGRSRFESLQIPSINEGRSRSNSNCSNGNNNLSMKRDCVNTRVKDEKENNRTSIVVPAPTREKENSQSTTTMNTIISDGQ